MNAFDVRILRVYINIEKYEVSNMNEYRRKAHLSHLVTFEIIVQTIFNEHFDCVEISNAPG